jgi:hypothetical protein
MTKHEMIPFEYEGYDAVMDFDAQYYEVVFLEDFGLFKKGTKTDCLVVAYSRGVIELYENDEVTVSCKIEVKPK